MNIRIKKALASGALAISLGALAFGVAGVSPALATDTPAPPADPQVLGDGATDLDTSITSVAWCGWYLSGVAADLTLVPVDGVTTTYNGLEIPLTAENSGLTAFVGGDNEHVDDVDNCSWYGDSNTQAVEVTITASSVLFSAESSLGSDAEMNFSLEESNKLNITVDQVEESCVGFTTTSEDPIWGEDTTSNPVTSAVYTDVGTNDICDWSVTYTTSIPGDMVPTYGGSIYSYTGPTLTTTLEIIDSAE